MRTGKTPYEIRLDLLTLASDILVRQREAKACIGTAGEDVVVYPTSEEIIAEAEKLNVFVSQSSDGK